MTRLFLDTNIVVDLLERREPFCHDAVRLFTMAYNKQVMLIVSPMTYATASFLLRKHGSEGVRNLITRNGKDFAPSKLPVMTATEYLATLE